MEMKAIHQDVQFSLEKLKEGILIKIKDNLSEIDSIRDNYGNFDAIVKKCSTYLLEVNYVDRYGRLKILRLPISSITQEQFNISNDYLLRVPSDLLNPELFKIGTAIKVSIKNQFKIEGLVSQNFGSKVKILYNKDGNLVSRFITSEQFKNEEVYLID